jgi:hypothetical protein
VWGAEEQGCGFGGGGVGVDASDTFSCDRAACSCYSGRVFFSQLRASILMRFVSIAFIFSVEILYTGIRWQAIR